MDFKLRMGGNSPHKKGVIVGNLMSDFVQSKPFSLEAIRDSIIVAQNEEIDFLSLMKAHHYFLQESIDIIIDPEATDLEKQMNLYRFFRLVEMHAKAEEETLYVELRHHTEEKARLEGYAGQDEHDLAFQLESELLEMKYLQDWTEEIAAKAKVAANLVRNHIKEEEDMIHPLVEKSIATDLLETMASDYLAKCLIYLDESESTSRNRPVRRQPVIENYLTPFF